MTPILGILGRYGPVRRTTAGRYRTWCPACQQTGSLLVVTGIAGERPASCVTGCPVGDIAAALRALDTPPHPGEAIDREQLSLDRTRLLAVKKTGLSRIEPVRVGVGRAPVGRANPNERAT